VGTLSDGWHIEPIPTKPAHEYDQRGETLRLFQDDCQVKAVNKPPIEVKQEHLEVKQEHREPVTDYLSLAIKAAKAYYRNTSLDHVNKVAKNLFRFNRTEHLENIMPDVVAQEIYDWIITLSEQPIYPEKKLRLAREFIVSLAPVSSPVEKPATS